MRLTRYCIGMTSKASLTVSPILCSRSPQQGQMWLSISITTSMRGKCSGSFPRLRRAGRFPRPSAPSGSLPPVTSSLAAARAACAVMVKRGSCPASSVSERGPKIVRLNSDRIIRSLSFSWIAASRWAIAALRSAESELHSADNAASREDSAITVCRSNAGSEGRCRPGSGGNLAWRILREHEGIVSGGEVNRLIARLCGERLPSIDLAHIDLSGGEQRPEQHGCGVC